MKTDLSADMPELFANSQPHKQQNEGQQIAGKSKSPMPLIQFDRFMAIGRELH